MMIARSRQTGREIPESLDQWLDKWQPKITSLRRRRTKAVSLKASGALDELEFLLARTIENQVTE